MNRPYLRTERQSDGASEITFIDNGKSVRFVVPPTGPVVASEPGGMTDSERRRALEEARAMAGAFVDFVSEELRTHRA